MNFFRNVDAAKEGRGEPRAKNAKTEGKYLQCKSTPGLFPGFLYFLAGGALAPGRILCFSEPRVTVGPDSVKNAVKFSISRKKATDTQSSLCALYRGRNSRNICKLPQRFYQRNSVEVSIIAKSDRLPKFYLATAFMNFYVTGRKSVDNQPFSTTV